MRYPEGHIPRPYLQNLLCNRSNGKCLCEEGAARGCLAGTLVIPFGVTRGRMSLEKYSGAIWPQFTHFGFEYLKF